MNQSDRSTKNHRKSSKIYEKLKKPTIFHHRNSKDTPRTCQNASKYWKTMKNSKYTPRTLEKLLIFRKILYLSPGKLLEIANFDEKSRKSNTKNPNGIARTRQNRIQKWARSVKISENLRKVEKSTIFNQRNSKDTTRTRQNAFQNWKTMKNRKYTPRTLEKLFIFRKILYLSPGKC